MKTDNTKQRLQEIIDNTLLEDSDKKLWSAFIKASDDEEQLGEIVEALEEDPMFIDFLTKNLKDKLTAMQTGDMDKVKEILEEEKDFLLGDKKKDVV